MNKLIIRHIAPASDSGVKCPPCEETGAYLRSIMEGLAPKLANLNIQLAFQSLELHEITASNCGKLNSVSFFGPELGITTERQIEEVLDAAIGFEQCEGCTLSNGSSFAVRTLKTDGQSFQSIPPGVLTDALIRVVFSSMGSCGGGGCASCAGCGEH